MSRIKNNLKMICNMETSSLEKYIFFYFDISTVFQGQQCSIFSSKYIDSTFTFFPFLVIFKSCQKMICKVHLNATSTTRTNDT